MINPKEFKTMFYVAILLWLVIVGTIGYVAYHFISKYW